MLRICASGLQHMEEEEGLNSQLNFSIALIVLNELADNAPTLFNVLDISYNTDFSNKINHPFLFHFVVFYKH